MTMLGDLSIAIIGAGAMGEAIIAGMLRKGMVSPQQLIASEPRAERRLELHARYGISLAATNVEAVQSSTIIIFAVKPQVLEQVLTPLRGTIPDSAFCISIIAGASLRTFIDTLEHPAIVRAMPNTPAQIGAGMIVWTASSQVSDQQRDYTRTILEALGSELFVDDEQFLDMATALAGSAPAYTFLIIEAMIDAGVQLGFARPVAEKLVLQTMLGSVRYALQSNLHPAQLRNAVTSPAGTTAAALNVLERGGIRSILSEAIWAAYHRSRELGKQDQ